MPSTSNTRADTTIRTRHVAGDAYEMTVRGHHILVDQPADSGGTDQAPTPTELFVAALTACVAFYAGRYLDRHGHSRDGLTVNADFTMADDRPARVSEVTVRVGVPPELSGARRDGLAAVAAHCTVHNSLTRPPAITIGVEAG